MLQPKEIWQVNTERIAQEIAASARDARTEEDLKMRVEPILRKAFTDIGIDTDIVAYEKSTAFRAKMDAVYGYLILEYKNPGRLATSASVTDVGDQLKRYLSEESTRHHPHAEDFLEKAVGVAIDGERILFVRYSKSAKIIAPPLPVRQEQVELFPKSKLQAGFHTLGPFPVSQDSLANLLIFIRSTARRPLTADDLAEVFGPDRPLAQQVVSELYSTTIKAQRTHGPSLARAFFAEWERIFGVVYGQELGKAQITAEETAARYRLPGGVRLKQLLFAIHTYYALLMKLIAIELLALQRESRVVSFVRGLGSLDDTSLKEKLAHLESGVDFAAQGVTNFLEADLFGWYLAEWNPTLAGVVRNVVRALEDFEPATPALEPEQTRDLLKELYELLVPKKLRHDLGEYYTPDWLAGYLIDRSGYNGDPEARMLDPACGSGTFLVEAIGRAVRRVHGSSAQEMGHVGSLILNNVVGFDLNPLSVLAARTNYLIAFAPFIPYVRPISLPVYLCDSVLTPSKASGDGDLDFDGMILTTTKGPFLFPPSMITKERIDEFMALVETGLKGRLDTARFAGLLRERLRLDRQDEKPLLAVYEKIKGLADRGENGIWARYIKNAFAPLYIGTFDFIIGNPPWIRWGYLADEYRGRIPRTHFISLEEIRPILLERARGASRGRRERLLHAFHLCRL